MKLLFCPNCGTMFSLPLREIGQCKCGLVKGRYTDRKYAETNGEGVCVAIDNNTLFYALNRNKNNKEEAYDIRAWIRPHEGEYNPHTTINEKLGEEK